MVVVAEPVLVMVMQEEVLVLVEEQLIQEQILQVITVFKLVVTQTSKAPTKEIR
tara:strand:+ start:201 stop:362 length:162 start_codon:yes stop_codon:yes gene_type:complete